MFTAHYDDDNDEGAISRYGVGVMLSSDYILAALMTDERKEELGVADQEHLAQREADQPKLREAGVGLAADEWNNFADLPQRLVRVPKREVDEKTLPGIGHAYANFLPVCHDLADTGDC